MTELQKVRDKMSSPPSALFSMKCISILGTYVTLLKIICMGNMFLPLVRQFNNLTSDAKDNRPNVKMFLVVFAENNSPGSLNFPAPGRNEFFHVFFPDLYNSELF